MVHKPSVRSVHATAQDLSRFSAFMAENETVPANRRAEFAQIAERLDSALAASGNAFYGGGVIGTPRGGDLRSRWETGSITNLEAIMRDAMPTLKATADADVSGTKFGTGAGINRLTSQIVHRDVKAVLDNERLGATRDPGAYVDNPLMGIVNREEAAAAVAAATAPAPMA
jgi:hypothetical protein